LGAGNQDVTSFLATHDPAGVPAAIGGYTNALEVAPGCRLLYVSGQIPETPDGDVPDDAEAQCWQVWRHIASCLASAEMVLTDLVKVTTFLSSRDLATINTAVRQEVLGDHRPALTVVIAEIFDPRWLLEIEAVAAAPAGCAT
jgi:2-iminobutanoate/2-iminopropanoate deaminase